MDFDSDRVTVVNTNPNFTGAAPVVDESLFEKERARNSFRYVCLGDGMVGRRKLEVFVGQVKKDVHSHNLWGF